ncbi:unnamed protein product [Onchocerca flexuosa]|uniref:No apical meristem-associated C-terminal domain-containing protein n=1 Tax=Onchocerca flexuosa TaxID=387005 RepID=A0A3P7W3R7_9BILA|nr:unnamed protein product [Onchocerca flexuosa]
MFQIGSFFFIIKDTSVEEESITDPFLRIEEVNINSRKRVASKEATEIIEDGCVTEKRKMVVKSEMEKLTPGTKDSRKEIKGKIAAQSNSSLSANEAWIQEQVLKDRKLVAKLGKEVKEKLDSAKFAYYRRIADFLPSDDEDDK